MKTEVRNEFILEAHKIACSEWKLKIEKECPELFESKSGWYKDKNKENKEWLAFKDFENNKTYGINANGNWFSQVFVLNVDYNEYLATEEEVKEALIKEAKKRGFKNGCSYIPLGYSEDYCTYKEIKEYEFENNKLCILGNHKYIDEEFTEKMHCGYIFKDGQWATIISNPIEEKIKKLEEKFKQEIDELKKQL